MRTAFSGFFFPSSRFISVLLALFRVIRGAECTKYQTKESDDLLNNPLYLQSCAVDDFSIDRSTWRSSRKEVTSGDRILTGAKQKHVGVTGVCLRS